MQHKLRYRKMLICYICIMLIQVYMVLRNEHFVVEIYYLIIQPITTMRYTTSIEIQILKSVLNVSSACCNTRISSDQTLYSDLRNCSPLCRLCCFQLQTCLQLWMTLFHHPTQLVSHVFKRKRDKKQIDALLT